jgi:8-oxo-dGTP diphosphatase
MQSRALVALLAAYAVEALTSADVTRCRDTLAPYAQSAGLTVTVDPRVGTDCADPTQGVDALVELAGRASAVCSQREVIPTLVAGVCIRLGRPTLPNDVGQVPRASVVVLHVAEGRRLVAREWLPAPGLAQRGGTPQPGG